MSRVCAMVAWEGEEGGSKMARGGHLTSRVVCQSAILPVWDLKLKLCYAMGALDGTARSHGEVTTVTVRPCDRAALLAPA